jgi:hypothetical protein
MKKTVLALTLVLTISLMFGVQFVSLVEANPFWGLTQYPGGYPAEPSQEFPTIKMESPKNGEVLATNTARISFTVTKPNSWDNYWYYLAPMLNQPMPVIGSYIVHVYLDGKLLGIVADPGPVGFPNADYSLSYERLARGIHNVGVVVGARTLYDDPETDGFLIYPKNITITRQFTVNADLPTPTPTATLEPSAIPRIMLNLKSFPTLVTASVSLATVMVGIGLFVYFKKRRR